MVQRCITVLSLPGTLDLEATTLALSTPLILYMHCSVDPSTPLPHYVL